MGDYSSKELPSLASFPTQGASDKVYIAIDSNKEYRWVNGSYQEIPRASKTGGLQAAYFGDSMTRQNYFVGATTSLYQDQGYFVWANAYLGQYFDLVNPDAGGVNGDTTSLMLNRIQASVLSYNPDVCFILAGFNDINNGVGYPTIVENLNTIYNSILKTGCKIIALAVLPSTSFNILKRESLCKVNLWIKNFSARNDGVIFVDTFTPMVDPASSTSAPLSGVLGDGIHPNTKGAQILGKTIAAALKNLFPPPAFVQSRGDIVSANNLTGNMVQNPLMYGSTVASGTGISGNIGTNWNPSLTGGTAVYSKVARTDFPNLEWQQVVFSNSSGFNQGAYVFAGTSVPAQVPAGSPIYFEVEANIVARTTNNITQFRADLLCNGALSLSAYGLGNNGAQTLNELGNMIIRTPTIILPADTTNLTYRVYCEISSGAGSVTFQVGRAEMRVAS